MEGKCLMANIGYVRVSSKDQNTGRQFAVMEECGIKLDRTYEEHVSGKNIADRPQLLAMLDYIREGDIVYIESISRLARNTVDFLDIANRLKEKGVGLISLKESIDTSTPQGRFVTTLFAAFAELERDFIRERQREGIDLCLREGRPYGRPRRSFDDIWKENYRQWRARKITSKEFMFREHLSSSGFYARVHRYEEILGKC